MTNCSYIVVVYGLIICAEVVERMGRRGSWASL